MKQQPEPSNNSTNVPDELVLAADEIKQLVKLLDVLMEVDFMLNRNQQGMVSDES